MLTAQSSGSGTTVDFTGIPLWAERVTIIFSGVSVSNSDDLLVQLGSGSVTTSGYTSVSMQISNGGTGVNATSTSGFAINISNSSYTIIGSMVITQMSSNLWVASHTIFDTTSRASYGAGSITLSGSLDRVRVTPAGAGTFDAGTINVMYE
jgi:hypothetical protein